MGFRVNIPLNAILHQEGRVSSRPYDFFWCLEFVYCEARHCTTRTSKSAPGPTTVLGFLDSMYRNALHCTSGGHSS